MLATILAIGEHKFCVIRGGEVQQIAVTEIVAGDICQVKYGKYIRCYMFMFKKKESYSSSIQN